MVRVTFGTQVVDIYVMCENPPPHCAVVPAGLTGGRGKGSPGEWKHLTSSAALATHLCGSALC